MIELFILLIVALTLIITVLSISFYRITKRLREELNGLGYEMETCYAKKDELRGRKDA